MDRTRNSAQPAADDTGDARGVKISLLPSEGGGRDSGLSRPYKEREAGELVSLQHSCSPVAYGGGIDLRKYRFVVSEGCAV